VDLVGRAISIPGSAIHGEADRCKSEKGNEGGPLVPRSVIGKKRKIGSRERVSLGMRVHGEDIG
jgi:hypothetical protein